VRGHLTATGSSYGHIRKEDEILYPWMDRNLSTAQVGALFSKFAETMNGRETLPGRGVHTVIGKTIYL